MDKQLRRPGARRGAPRRVLLLSAALATAFLIAPSASGQSGPTSYSLVADASGSTSSASAPAFTVVDTLVELGGSVAQTVVNSLGISQGFAANPTPGELVLTGPGLFAGLSGLPIPNEQFPTTVQSSHPAQPEQTGGTPPSRLEARSEAQSSSALAISGAEGGGRIHSTADSFIEDGRSVARAHVIGGPITIGPVVITDFESTAVASVDESGTPHADASLTMGAVLVDGQGALLGPDGLELAGNDVPLPAATTPEELVAQGVEVRILEGSVDPEAGTATSPSILIEVRQVLDEGIPGVIPAGQEVILRWIVGRTTAAATAVVPVPTPPRVPDPPAGPTAGPPAVAPPTAPGPPPAVVPAPAPEPVVEPRTPTTGPAPAASPSYQPVATPIDSFLFYPVLVLATASALVSMHTIRTSGRRRLWRAADHRPAKEIPHA